MTRFTAPDGRPAVHVETREAWRSWLEQHHATETGVWLASWKATTGRPRPSYEDSVEEALCFGWIDSKGRALDAERSLLWFAPRRAGSGWSRPNKQRIERLERANLLAEAGRRVIDRAKQDGSWTLLDAVEDLVVPDDLARAFAERPGSREHWESLPRSAKRSSLEWIVQAKRTETRQRRVTATADAAERGERVNG